MTVRDPFDRWLNFTRKPTRYLASRVRRSLEPRIFSQGFARVYTIRGNAGLRETAYILRFERRGDDAYQAISIQFETYGRALFKINVDDSTRETNQKPYYPNPALYRRPRAGGYRAWYGLHVWEFLLPLLPEANWQQWIDREVELAEQHLMQAFDYLDRGAIGPNLRVYVPKR